MTEGRSACRPREKQEPPRAASHWIFKPFFEDNIFRELAGYRFVLKTPGERNPVQKLSAFH
jgi:hypothetical protein